MTRQWVSTEPATMPIALPVQRPTGRVSRGRQRRADAMLELRESLTLEARLVGQQMRTPEDEQQRALSRNEFRHLVVTLCTFGLWGPVWLYVVARNTRRYGRTAQGWVSAGHVRSERARLRGEQRARRRALPRGFAEPTPKP